MAKRVINMTVNNCEKLITVVVCTFNRAALLPHCLDALVNQTLDKGQFEVLIVDNNSTDNTQQIVEQYANQYSNFRGVKELKQGHSHARNRGWREAKGQFIAYIDDDTRATPEWCQFILEAFLTVKPTPAAVGGEIHPWYEVKPPGWFSDALEIRTWGNNAGFLQPPGARYGFSGANMAFPKQIIEQNGGFSSRYGIVNGKLRMGEDTELFTRIYQVQPCFWYDPKIKVYHWTTHDMMTLAYRFKRSFKSGQSSAYLHHRKKLSPSYLRSWLGLIVLFMRSTVSLVVTPGKFSTKCVKKFEELAHRLGFLLG